MIDRSEEVDGVVGAHRCRASSAGHTDSVANEQEAVVAANVVQIELVFEKSSDGSHRASRVATMSCVMPPDSPRCSASEKPTLRSSANIVSGGGK